MAEDRKDLVGIGGWLLFFLIALGAISPVANLIALIGLYSDPAIPAAYGDKWPSLLTAEWVLTGLFCAGAWFLVWRMVKVRRWSSVRLTIPGLWILTVGGMFAELAAVSWIAGIPFGALVGEMGAESIRPFAFSTIWTLYLNISKRVRNTYPRHGDQQEVAEVFG